MKTISSLALFLLALLCGCICPQNYHPMECPPPMPDCLVPRDFKIALVLGGGGAKGMAHIGVIEEFEKAHIPFDMIIGCSAGSIVGALYADCQDIQRIKSILEPMKTESIMHINLWNARYGLCQGNVLRKFLERNLCARHFDELQIPFAAVATDLYSGELVVMGGGNIIPSVMASSAIPFAFVPVQLNGRILVDGGVIDPVPVQVARQLGAEIVIVVDLQALLEETFPRHLFGVAKRSAEITLLWQSFYCVSGADIHIRPQLGCMSAFDDDHNDVIYEAGKEAARQAIPKIRELILQKCPYKMTR